MPDNKTASDPFVHSLETALTIMNTAIEWLKLGSAMARAENIKVEQAPDPEGGLMLKMTMPSGSEHILRDRHTFTPFTWAERDYILAGLRMLHAVHVPLEIEQIARNDGTDQEHAFPTVAEIEALCDRVRACALSDNDD